MSTLAPTTAAPGVTLPTLTKEITQRQIDV